MKLDLWSFLEGKKDILEFQGKLECTDLKLKDREVKIVEPIEYKGEIFKVDRDKTINLNVKYTYSEKCNRCLAPSTGKIETNLYGKLLEGKTSLEDENDGYEEVLYYVNGILRLDEYIREQVIVSLPIKTLCDDDCKGLCPKCGVDLNKEKCDCVHEDIDPRLEKLKDFFSKD
jgi:DUF177 domain-containing protein